MKQLKIIGLSLLAVFALGAIVASTALAEEGALPLTKKGVTVTGEKPTLETEKSKIQCETVSADKGAAFENDHHGKGTLHFLKCKAEGLVAINSLGDKSGEILTPVLFLLCLITPASLVWGIAVYIDPPVAPNGPVHLEVPLNGQLLIVTGLVIGTIELTGEPEAASFNVKFVGKKGKQENATECSRTEETEAKKHTLASETNESKVVEAASEEVTKGVLTFEEKVKLMDK